MLGNHPVAATLPAEDLARAVKFYTDTLGLKVVNQGEGGVMLEAGSGTQVFMYQRERTKAEHTAATFFVADLDAVVNGLIARGVTFEQYEMGELKTDARGIAESPEGKAAWLTDPEGNILALFEM
jgi:catechol-2,3-dioxygenase